MLPLKADPYGFRSEVRPNTGSMVARLDAHTWQDADWIERRKSTKWLDAPISIYEVHLGSWRKVPEAGNRWLSYRELGDQLIPYVKETRLHAHRIAAHHGTSLRWLVGLSDHRIFRGDQPLWVACRLHGIHRPLPSGGARRAPRLDAGALPARYARAFTIRRHTPL